MIQGARTRVVIINSPTLNYEELARVGWILHSWPNNTHSHLFLLFHIFSLQNRNNTLETPNKNSKLNFFKPLYLRLIIKQKIEMLNPKSDTKNIGFEPNYS